MTAYAIETHELSKRYGKLTALDRLDLRVPEGTLFGFIGPNGAGKTTTLRLLAGLMEPDGGEVRVMGHNMAEDPSGLRRLIGYMPDFFGVYEDMRVWEYLDFYARCYDVPARKRSVMIGELLALVGLAEKREADVSSLSRGMQQRLCLAHALVHDPKILLLDEPASGLDPRARVEMRELLRQLASMGKTVLVSSHILAELAEMCNQVGIIERGRLVASGDMDGIRRQMQAARLLEIRVLGAAEPALALVAAYPGAGRGAAVIAVNRGQAGDGLGHTIEAPFDGDEQAAAGLLANLVNNGIVVASFRETGNNLEEIFLRVTTGE